ncbi:MAG: hypothetical protein ACK5Z2_13965 [Bacteroidota bacterium]|jgi:chromosome partitioning protein
MSNKAPVITFYSVSDDRKEAVVIYNLLYMLGREKSVVCIDLHPAQKLSELLLNQHPKEKVYAEKSLNNINGIFHSFSEGNFQIEPIQLTDKLFLISGNRDYSRLEDHLAKEWLSAYNAGTKSTNLANLQLSSVLYHVFIKIRLNFEPDLIIVFTSDYGGYIHRNAVLSSQYLIATILSDDILAASKLAKIGASLSTWKEQWENILSKISNDTKTDLPAGNFSARGYVLFNGQQGQQQAKADLYHLNISHKEKITLDTDDDCVGIVFNYPSIYEMAEQSQKPVFELTPADGAIYAHAAAVRKVEESYKLLADKIIHISENKSIC